MENASKALIIAGAVLIAILLIALGLVIYNNSKGVIETGSKQMNATEIQIFNSQFTKYEGVQNGANLKSLLNAVIANNSTYSDDESRQVAVSPAKGIFLTYQGFTGRKETTVISSWANEAKFSQKYKVICQKNEDGLVETISILLAD